MSDRAQRPIVFLDFDGTISIGDVVDTILERYADLDWLRVEQEWAAGRLGSRECLQQQMALVRASRAEIDTLLDDVQVDEGLVPLLEACTRHRLAVHIVSDGFDCFIHRILARLSPEARQLLDGVRVCASHLEPLAGGRWRTAFPFFRRPCAHGCATCKPAVMRALNPSGAPALFVGDGLSDRYASVDAAVVFAKDKLARFCSEHGIAYVHYESLADVGAFIDETIRRERAWPPAAAAASA